jgi:hypothetical protein
MWVTPYDVTSPPARVKILIGVQPTATDPPLDAKQPTASAGLWTITVQSTANVKLEAWIGRKMDGTAGRRKGQSYFDDPAYSRFRPIRSHANSILPYPDTHAASAPSAALRLAKAPMSWELATVPPSYRLLTRRAARRPAVTEQRCPPILLPWERIRVCFAVYLPLERAAGRPWQ